MRYLPIIAAAVSTMIVGFLWYSPMMFAIPWMRAMGYDPNDKARMEAMKKSAGPLYASAFVATLVTAAVLYMLRNLLHIDSALAGMRLGLLAWMGFVAPVQFTDAIFGKRGQKLLLINSGYQLVCHLAMGAIIGGWRP